MIEIETYLRSLNVPVCLSGGAKGSDVEWGNTAKRAGHHVLHWSFEGHNTTAAKDQIVKLTNQQLLAAYPAVKRANSTLKRRFPTKDVTTTNLLCRNWYQIAATNSLYAMIEFESLNEIKGGTAWAIQMYIDRFLCDKEDINNCKLYAYCLTHRVWWQWKEKWKILETPPSKPNGVWTGIGARKLPVIGKWQIRRLFGEIKTIDEDVEELHPIITDPKVDDVIYVTKDTLTNKCSDISDGWGKIQKIQTNEKDTYINIAGILNKQFSWKELSCLQVELRQALKMKKAQMKF